VLVAKTCPCRRQTLRKGQ